MLFPNCSSGITALGKIGSRTGQPSKLRVVGKDDYNLTYESNFTWVLVLLLVPGLLVSPTYDSGIRRAPGTDQ